MILCQRDLLSKLVLAVLASRLFIAEVLAADVTIKPFEVKEVAGIRRRSDVVSTLYMLPAAVSTKTRFRVMAGEQPVSAQIVPQSHGDNQIDSVSIDFIDHFAPYETRQYRLEYGAGLTTQPPADTRFVLVDDPDAFRINNHDIIEWLVPKDLSGILTFEKLPDLPFVRSGSTGFTFRMKGSRVRLSDRKPTIARVVRSGPIACGLEFVYEDWPAGCESRVTMEFVRTKSWVLANWTVKGNSLPDTVSAELGLILDGREKLIDFASGDFVYTTVSEDQIAILESDYDNHQVPWRVVRGKARDLEVQVVAPRNAPLDGLGGWVHVMDQKRCAAIAFSKFGIGGRDRIEVAGDGRVLLERTFRSSGSPGGSRELAFAIHFVTMPVHIGARTSPQAMRSPLEVVWELGGTQE